LLLFMPMGWDYISQLWLPVGLLFILKMIYEYGEPQWNDTDGKTEEHWEKPVTVPLFPPQVPHGLIGTYVVIQLLLSDEINCTDSCRFLHEEYYFYYYLNIYVFSQYSVWLQTGWPCDCGSIPGRGRECFL
jgi:hypothetical protein